MFQARFEHHRFSAGFRDIAHATFDITHIGVGAIAVVTFFFFVHFPVPAPGRQRAVDIATSILPSVFASFVALLTKLRV